jgi:hypothetical protein
MQVFVCLALLCVVGISAHDVIGIVINDTPYYMDLTKSELKKGSVIYLPAIRLAPYEYTNFTLQSPFIGDDQIKYLFGYTPEVNWCADYTSPSQMSAKYEYSFGSNSCSGSSTTCTDGFYMVMEYNQCSTFWGTSRPTYSMQKLQQ